MNLSVETRVRAPLEQVWLCWTLPEHIIHWNFADNEWSCSSARNNLRVGGTFDYRIESKDGQSGYTISGTYTEVIRTKLISYQLEDGRRFSVMFEQLTDEIRLVQRFEAAPAEDKEVQQRIWQAILDRFALYTESMD